jgi:enamine deaminase RidA (YjgF/YER057c/UK114 family)
MNHLPRTPAKADIIGVPIFEHAVDARHNGWSQGRAGVSARVRMSHFDGAGGGGVGEFHLTVSPTGYGDFASQLACVEAAYHEALAAAHLDPETAIMRRFFCSDLANQVPELDARSFSRPGDREHPCAVSRVCMPPAPPAKVALWAFHVRDPESPLLKRQEGDTLVWSREGAEELSHCWTTGLADPDGPTAYDQTLSTLARYDAELEQQGLFWCTDVVRTWLFVRDIGTNYDGVVAARRLVFEEHGLTAQTHFIASTGIQGEGVHPTAVLSLDAYAVRGLRPGQVTFLAAPDHLKPPHLYGVTFERGTAVDYRDRRQIFISGTASIDPQGRILHPGDVVRQLDRALDNIEALLRGAGATLGDMGVLIAYVRDPADQGVVAERLHLRCDATSTPLEVLVAPICRPGWLVEVEGMATVGIRRPDLPAF